MPDQIAEQGAWLPDGHGLDSVTLETIAAYGKPVRVHLRLTSPGGASARGGCDGGLGELWSGKPAEVTCPGCLQVVHS